MVIPRPIARTSTVYPEPTPNLAPFGFFNVSTTPPVPGLSVTTGDSNEPDGVKDTHRNIRDTEAFVSNIVPRPRFERMNKTNARLTASEDEWAHAEIEPAESGPVEPSRVAEADIAFELSPRPPPGWKSAGFLRDIVHAHSDDAVTTDGRIDVREVDANAARPGGSSTTIEASGRLDGPP